MIHWPAGSSALRSISSANSLPAMRNGRGQGCWDSLPLAAGILTIISERASRLAPVNWSSWGPDWIRGPIASSSSKGAATQQVKLGKLVRVFGDLPEHVTYVPIDFNAETLQKLFDFGYSPQVKTLFIWEGVVHYLTAEAVDQTLESVLQNSGLGSSIIFDYVYPPALTAAHKREEVIRMQQAERYTGEGLVFGIEEGQAVEFLRVRGYTQIQYVTGEDLKKLYFTGVNLTRAVAPTYAIVHATVEVQNLITRWEVCHVRYSRSLLLGFHRHVRTSCRHRLGQRNKAGQERSTRFCCCDDLRCVPHYTRLALLPSAAF